jgi:hypothetical protein
MITMMNTEKNPESSTYHYEMLQVSFTGHILKETQELIYLGTNPNSNVHKQLIGYLNSGHFRRSESSKEPSIMM